MLCLTGSSGPCRNWISPAQLMSGNLFSLLMLTQCSPKLSTCTFCYSEVPNNFLRINSVDVQLKVNKMGHFFPSNSFDEAMPNLMVKCKRSLPFGTKFTQDRAWRQHWPMASALSHLHLLFSISPELRHLGVSCGWGLFCWEILPIPVLCEHWQTIRCLMQISANTFYFQRETKGTDDSHWLSQWLKETTSGSSGIEQFRPVLMHVYIF